MAQGCSDEQSHQRPDQARSPQRGPRLPPDSRVDGRSLLVLRVPEVVRVRGPGADSLYQQRAADFLDVPRVRRPRSELVSRRVGLVVRSALVSGMLATALGYYWRPWLVSVLYRNYQ